MRRIENLHFYIFAKTLSSKSDHEEILNKSKLSDSLQKIGLRYSNVSEQLKTKKGWGTGPDWRIPKIYDS